MKTIDIIITILLAIFFIIGFRKGLIREVVTFIGFFIAIIGSMALTHFFMLKLNIQSASGIGPYITYFIVFVAIFLIISLSGRILEKIIKTIQLNFLNRISGGIIGLFKMAFLVSLIFWLSAQARFIPNNKLEESVYYRPLKPVAPKIIEFVTDNIYIAKGIISDIEYFFESKTRQEHK